jgi:hypothetical protein
MTDALLPIKGQETRFTFTSPKGLETCITKIKESSFSFDLETITEQYLGETADQFDDIFRGISLELTFDLVTPTLYDLVEQIIARAQRRTPASGQFSCVSVLNFPTGEKRRMLFPNLKFAEIPTSFGGRDEYGEVKFTMKGSSYRKL